MLVSMEKFRSAAVGAASGAMALANAGNCDAPEARAWIAQVLSDADRHGR